MPKRALQNFALSDAELAELAVNTAKFKREIVQAAGGLLDAVVNHVAAYPREAGARFTAALLDRGLVAEGRNRRYDAIENWQFSYEYAGFGTPFDLRAYFRPGPLPPPIGWFGCS